MYPPTNSRNKWPGRLVVILLIIFAFNIGRNGVGTPVEILKRILPLALEILEATEQEAENPPEGDETQAFQLTPRSVESKPAQNQLGFQFWDQNGDPIGDICVFLNQGAINRTAVSDEQTGVAKLDILPFPDGTSIRLVINPINHTYLLNDEFNDFTFDKNSSHAGSTICFMQTPTTDGSNGGFTYKEVNCDDRPGISSTADATPSPLPNKQNESASLGPNETPTPDVPLTFVDGFDYNDKGWPVGGNRTVTGSVDGNVQIRNGVLVLNGNFKLEDHRMYRTTIPTGRDLENFAFSTELKSMVQPQNPEDLGRFNFQFRVQEDGRYYNLCINHNGHTTLYYFYPGEDGLMDHQLIESWKGSDWGYDPAEEAVNKIVVRVNDNLFSVRFNDEIPFVIEEEMNFIFDPGKMSIALDGSEDNVISYWMDNLRIQEWSAD